MIVECHPNFNIPADGPAVSIRPSRPRAHTYSMGTALLADVHFKISESGRRRAVKENVKNVHAWVIGDLLEEMTEQYEPTDRMLHNMVPVTYHYNIGRFLTIDSRPGRVVDVTDGTFSAAYCVGRRLFIHRSW